METPRTLEGRTALVTASTEGIGKGIAQALLDAGANVVVSSRSSEKGEKALADLAQPDRTHFIAADVTSQADVETLVDGTVERYGSLDVLVNNAGGSDDFSRVHEMSETTWQKAIAWTLHSAFWATRRSIPHMLDHGWGRIINVTSVEAKVVTKATVSHYVSGKFALTGLTKATACDYGQDGITCNAISPGPIETERMMEVGPEAAKSWGMTYEEFKDGYASESAIKRLNTVEEVAAVALMLCGPHSGGITGSVFNVDGGNAGC